MAPSKVTITNNRARNELFCKFFFSEVNPMSWICKKCGKTKTKNGGWTNLLFTFAVALVKTFVVCLTMLTMTVTTTATMVALVVMLFN